jgi:regulator of protease activity HflC (stomatin/prohibitin superfamily)
MVVGQYVKILLYHACMTLFDYKTVRGELNITKIAQHSVIGATGLVLLFGALGSVRTIGEREVAVVTRFGKVIDTLNPGLHFTVPFLDDVAVTYSSEIKSTSVDANSATKDQQSVVVTTNLQYRLDVTKANDLYKSIKDQRYLDSTILPPILNEATKSIVSKYSSFELLDKRDQVKKEIEDAVQARSKEFFITVSAVNLVNIDWSAAYDAAIEAKVIAEQQASQAKQNLEKVKIDAETARVQAQGQADANTILGNSIRSNPDILELKKVEKWNGILPTVTGSSGQIINLK